MAPPSAFWMALTMVSMFVSSSEASSPHIILIVADDLGWNDVSWQNSDILTPNLNTLATEGVILNSSYVQSRCSPTRGALLTGRYPYNIGLQNSVIRPLQPNGLPLSYTILPEKLRDLGYRTHIVGKWHLGFCHWNYTPTYRGFDTFTGFYLSGQDYYSHSRSFRTTAKAYDFRNNTTVYNDAKGTYSTELFGDRAVEIITNHDPATPLFLYQSFQSPHSPLQVPDTYSNMYSGTINNKRKTYSGMVTAMDDAVGDIKQALEDTGLIDDAIIIFTTDNGANVNIGGNNWPLRGAKSTLWEGGHRAAAFVYSKTLFTQTGYTNNELIHAVDWYPTLLTLAGGTPESDIDGVDQWATLSQGSASNRTEFVYNIDDDEQNAAIRMGSYKMMKGPAGKYNDWYSIPTTKLSSVTAVDDTTDADTYRLYNIDDDPTESTDISTQYPDVLTAMQTRLTELRATMVPAVDGTQDARGDPANFLDVWSPGWC